MNSYICKLMESTRQQKISRLLQKDLGEIFRRETPLMVASNILLSVTKVYVTKDLSLARVYLSIFNAPDNKEVMKVLETHRKRIRMILAQNVKNQLRVIPDLAFFNDDSLDYLENIENLLKQS